MTSWLHEERLDAVMAAIRDTGARSVLDLGCGDGDLLLRLASEPRVERITGVDLSLPAIERLRSSLRALPAGPKIDLIHGSMIEPDPALAGFDCAALVETIEHLEPARLSKLERALFGVFRPGAVIVTTPNAEFNTLLGVPPGRFRRNDHMFEWDRARFRRWAKAAATAGGYEVAFADIGGRHHALGGASQMAVFHRQSG
ncbi:MAG: methyltransferase domain-containing protein [Paracoccaceae bacterium]